MITKMIIIATVAVIACVAGGLVRRRNKRKDWGEIKKVNGVGGV